MRHHNRRAFALVELSTSVAIVASMIAMLLPTVQRAHEVALAAPLPATRPDQNPSIALSPAVTETSNLRTLLEGPMPVEHIGSNLHFTPGWALQLPN
jgi:hypothetical protein